MYELNKWITESNQIIELRIRFSYCYQISESLHYHWLIQVIQVYCCLSNMSKQPIILMYSCPKHFDLDPHHS